MTGEVTSEEELENYTEITKYIDGGAVLGYGTKSGGYMKVQDKITDELEYLEDRSSNELPRPKAISKIDEESLKKLAKDMQIDYIHMEKQSDINEKINQIKNEVEKGTDKNDISGYSDIYYIFVIPVLGLLVYEFLKLKKNFE